MSNVNPMPSEILRVRCENEGVPDAARAGNIPVRTLDADFCLPPDATESNFAPDMEEGRAEGGLNDWIQLDRSLSIAENDGFVLVENLYPK